MTRSRFVVLHCVQPGCPRTATPDPRHLANLTAGGGWLCWEHDLPGLMEVPC